MQARKRVVLWSPHVTDEFVMLGSELALSSVSTSGPSLLSGMRVFLYAHMKSVWNECM
jgi:hypothetical protein